MRTFPLTAAVLLGLLAAAGCARVDPKPDRRQPYTGPTESQIDVVQAINRNNQPLPTLWASHYYEATIVDPKTKGSTWLNGTGALLYRRPLGFRLVGKKDVIGDVFEVGSTDERYWMKAAEPDPARLWYGEHKNAGKPCVEQIPIQPNLVMEVLGVGLIDTDLTKFPAPVMRFNPDADAYMFVWVSPAGGAGAGPSRLAAQREVWYDRATKLPTLVVLFNADGRPVLRANLAKHRAVEVADTPQDRRPKVATDYRLYFPDTGSRMAFTLEEIELDRRGVPSRRGIVFPGATPEDAGVREVIKLDKNCTD